MQNYFNYFTEIEEHFQHRRGTLLMLSTLDWALIAMWQEAGFPLEAVRSGIDATFEKYESRKAKGRARRINGLAYCAQEVLHAVENMHEAATGIARKQRPSPEESGFEWARIAAYLTNAAAELHSARLEKEIQSIAGEVANRLGELAQSFQDSNSGALSMESLEQNLIALEEKLFAAIQTFTPEATLLALRVQSAAELAPYRRRLQTAQIRQIEQQLLRRRLFADLRIPRLSLFYMQQQ